MDHFQTLLLAGVLAVTIAGSYIIWGPSQKARRSAKVPGLQNVGNSCFVNAVLQALAACPLFLTWLKKVVEQGEKKNDCKYSLCNKLLCLLKDLNSTYGLCSPSEVIEALQRKGWVISNDEQDAHELFHVLTATLEEEIVNSPPVLSLLEVAKLEAVKCVMPDSKRKPFVCSTVGRPRKNVLPVKGLLANQLVCKQCGHKYPVKYDTFDSISLSIPSPHWGPLKLQDCLKSYVSCEKVSDVCCDICCKKESEEEPKGKTTFIKQLSFGKLPEILCFHIQRTVWMDSGVPAKCFDHVTFPEILCMDNFVYKSPLSKNNKDAVPPLLIGGNTAQERQQIVHALSKQVKQPLPTESSPGTSTVAAASVTNKRLQSNLHLFVLRAVIVHVGDLLSGHFVTYRRSSAEKKWFYTSDSSTREVTFSDVAKVCAYMLFYEKT